jgi:hypothetical protein
MQQRDKAEYILVYEGVLQKKTAPSVPDKAD